MNKTLTHLDEGGRARMVDVSDKESTAREALARGRVRMATETLQQVLAGNTPKGDIRAVCEIAGVMGGKRTADLIPLCHPLPLTSLKVAIEPDEAASALIVTARAKTIGPTGVEMEALTAVCVACLAIYDMLKAIDKAMTIEEIVLVEKRGGKSGDYTRSEK